MIPARLTGIIDYGAGNLGSVENALRQLGANARLVKNPEEIAINSPFEKIIFPGDGHFATAMEKLDASGFSRAIREWISADKPFLGICIGLQLLFDSSEETLQNETNDGSAVSRGLGVFPGTVKKFPGRKIPQIGWNSTKACKNKGIFRDIPQDTFFYYIHSFYAAPADIGIIAAKTEYYLEYCSAVESGSVAAIQFHPEKSGRWGLKLLQNWLEGK